MSAIAQRPAPRPYRDFLTPALHRRFTSAVLVTLLVCCVEALWLGGWRRIWPLLGLAFVRTLLLFISSLAIYILRVAQLHIGSRTTVYPFETLYQYIWRFEPYQTLIWYTFSAWWFSEVYIWSAPADAKLGWVDPGKAYERPKLNERPVFLRSMFFGLAIAQSLVHLYRDYDRVAFPSWKAQAGPKDASKNPDAAPPRTQLNSSINSIAFRSALRVVSVLLIAPILYFLVLRRPAWNLAYTVARRVVHLPKATAPSGLTLAEWVHLAGRFAVEGFLIAFLWEFSNTAFAAYVAQEPLKKGRLLTDDSKDPNGSLIAGLKAKREVPRSFAFRELALITHCFPSRRQTIYTEIDRPGGSTWSQILSLCLSEMDNITTRIQANTTPTPSSPLSRERQPNAPLHTLPKIARPPRTDPIVASPPPPRSPLALATSALDALAKNQSDPSNPRPIGPQAKKLIEYGGSKLLPPGTQQQLAPSALKSRAGGYVEALLRSPVGAPFRQTRRRRVVAVVHGGPVGAEGSIRDAARAVAGLAVWSLKEDRYGNVAKDVPNIIRTFVATVRNVEGFAAGLERHWTDIWGKDGEEVPEVQETVEVLRGCLEEVLRAFGEYSDGLNMSVAEIKEAKEVVGQGREKEMTEKRK